MPSLFHLVEYNWLSSWVTAGGVVGMFGLMLRFLPNWIKTKASERLTDSDIAVKLRNELFTRLNECEEKHQEMYEQNQELRNRVSLLEDGDRRKTIALSLLMNEIMRLDPSSDIIVRAKAVLELGVNLMTPIDEKIKESIRKLEKEG